MSKLTLDEAIKHCLEVAEQNEKKAKYRPRMDYYDEIESRADCLECAADHRQLAEWLMEYKDLKAEQNDQYVFIHELISEFKEAKQLLKAAVNDFAFVSDNFINNMDSFCSMYNHMAGCVEGCPMNSSDDYGRCKWRYTDEVEKLIES